MSDNNLTPGQEGDAVAVYLAEVRQAAGLLAKTKAPSWGTVPRIKRMIGYAERLADAVEIALNEHQEHEGRCVTCLEPCNCPGDAYGPLIGKGLPASEVHRIVCEAWENCTHGNEVWPCKPHRDITAGLTGKGGTGEA